MRPLPCQSRGDLTTNVTDCGDSCRRQGRVRSPRSPLYGYRISVASSEPRTSFVNHVGLRLSTLNSNFYLASQLIGSVRKDDIEDKFVLGCTEHEVSSACSLRSCTAENCNPLGRPISRTLPLLLLHPPGHIRRQFLLSNFVCAVDKSVVLSAHTFLSSYVRVFVDAGPPSECSNACKARFWGYLE